MVCLACRQWAGARLCDGCAATLAPGGCRWLGSGVLVASAFLHEGAARSVVHRLKYDAVTSASAWLAEAVAPLTAEAAALVPVPRVVWRRIRLGVDPALELARSVSALTGVPVLEAIVPAWFGRAHAGRNRTVSTGEGRGVRAAIPPEAVLIDDVVTTGATLSTAAATTGIRRAVTATSRPLTAAANDGDADISWSG